MPPPNTVRIGIWLIGLTLLTDLIASLRPRAHMTGGIGQAATTFLIFGCLLYAIGRRRNWARLVFTFLYIVGVFFALTMMGRFRSAGRSPWSSLWVSLSSKERGSRACSCRPLPRATTHRGAAA